MPETYLTLTRDCRAAVIPAGDEIQLPGGSQVELIQNLGGNLTVKYQGILYRIDESNTESIDTEQLEAVSKSSGGAQPIPEDSPFTEDLLWQTLKSCYDPEIPINIVDLGLIYDLQHREAEENKHDVSVKMTLTAQGCGMGPVIAEDARRKLENLACVHQAEVEIVWDPPWTPHMISPEGRERLGIS